MILIRSEIERAEMVVITMSMLLQLTSKATWADDDGGWCEYWGGVEWSGVMRFAPSDLWELQVWPGPAISICGNRDLVPSEQRPVQNAGTINVAVQQLVAEVLMLQCWCCSCWMQGLGRPRVANLESYNNFVVIYLCIHFSLIASSLH